MTNDQPLDELIGALDQAVTDTLEFFRGVGQHSDARIGEWGAWEVLAHFGYWHYATAWGIASALASGPPWPIPSGPDEVNAACLRLHEGESFDDLIDQLDRAHARLLREARAISDLDAAAFNRPDGGVVSIRQRLQAIARHWRSHLDALQEAAG